MSELAAAVLPHLADALAGDAKARDSIWRAVEHFVRDVAARIWRRAQPADLDEVVSDVAAKLLVGPKPAIKDYDPTRPMRPWLAKLVRRVVLNRMRAMKRRARAEAAVPPPLRAVEGPAEAAMREETSLMVRRVIREMSATDQIMLFGILDDGLTHKEAAAKAQLGEQAAQRAKKRLSDLLRKPLGDSELGDVPKNPDEIPGANDHPGSREA